MKSIKIILLGIATILFGIACYIIGYTASWSVYALLGCVCTFVGIGLSIYGCIKKE